MQKAQVFEAVAEDQSMTVDLLFGPQVKVTQLDHGRCMISIPAVEMKHSVFSEFGFDELERRFGKEFADGMHVRLSRVLECELAVQAIRDYMLV